VVNFYSIALFLHISALLAAMAASGINHFADSRMLAAQTVGELRQWGMVAGKSGKVFPFALLALFATGAYMVATAWTWDIGWIDVAIGGVALLFILGGVIGGRGKALGRALGGAPSDPVSAAATQMLRDPIKRSIANVPTALSIGIVFLMVNKPSLAGSIITLMVAIAVGVALGIPSWRGKHANVVGASEVAGAEKEALEVR
jgi:hypothetical protein